MSRGQGQGQAVVPRHVAIIMDGNGRWARARGLPRAAGHRRGARIAHDIVAVASKAGVEALTLFAFSSENWRRPAHEVRLLLDLLRRTIKKELAGLHANGVRLSFVGSRERFPDALIREMDQSEQHTAGNRGLQLNIAVDYGGRWDVVRRTRELACRVERGELAVDDIDERCFDTGMSLAHCPAPDLLIRTGGESRLSNFLLWETAYSELYFTDVLWPDFSDETLHAAIDWFARRERRFGDVADGAPRR